MNSSLCRTALAVSLLAPAVAAAAGPQWVGSWAASPLPQNPSTFSSPPRLTNRTLRQTVHLSAGGDRVRVRLDNTFGDRPLVVRSARVGDAVPLTFDGRPGVTIPPGAPMWSDPAPVHCPAGVDLTVTLTFGDAPAVVTGHSVALATSVLSDGPATTRPAAGETVNHWSVLDGVDVEAPPGDPAAVVAFGDSITDGDHSTPDANRRWTDRLAARLAADPATVGVGVLNEGVAGNRLTDNGIGPGGLARFDRDVLGQTAVRWVVLLEGVNDIGNDHHPDGGGIVARLELADRQLVARAHAHGLRVFGGTILPFAGSFYASDARERDRQAVNAWLRTSGTFDAVVDFDAATRDPAHPDRLLPAYDCGDHLHPNDAGYRRMGDAIDLDPFRR